MLTIFIVFIVLQEITDFVVSRSLAAELKVHDSEMYSKLGTPHTSFFSRMVSLRMTLFVLWPQAAYANSTIQKQCTFLRLVWGDRIIEGITILFYVNFANQI